MESTQSPFVTREQRLEPEFDYLPPSSGEIKNKRSYIHLMAWAEKNIYFVPADIYMFVGWLCCIKWSDFHCTS
jgi:hypothetical protein